MIFGSEGLPRSGKSLEAMQHILDSVAAGRTVVTNIYGIDYKAFSEALSIPEPSVRRMLISLSAPDGMEEDKIIPYIKEQFLAHKINDSLWIWDEINQFWPPDRQPLSPEWARFVTEHGQLGIDVLIMGQDLTELHQTWRKRVQRYTRYTKLDMMGKEDSFHWASYSNAGRGRFKKTADGQKPYNKKLYPLYKSHRSDTQNKQNYKDSRFGIFQKKHKFYGFLFFLFFCYAIYTIFGFFKHPAPADKPSQAVASPALASVEKPVAVVAAPVPAVPVEPVHIDSKPEPIDYFDKFASKFDLRLAAILERKPEPGDSRPWLEFQIDVVDPSFRVKERFDRKSLAALGWAIERTDYGIKLSKQDIVYVVRPWPLDNFGKVPNKTTSDLRTGPQTSELAQPSKGLSVSSSVSTGNAGARFTVVEDTSRFHASTGSSQ
ncbi:zonular occludens toxin domain-containing protein [Pseudomonas sp. PCH446]